jgi:lipid-binding SYLF domain-containing protein
MKKLFLTVMMVAFAPFALQANATPRLERLELRAEKAAQVLDAYMSNNLTAIPDRLMAEAECIYVVPDVVRVGFVFGVRTGQGLLSCRANGAWSNPVFYNVTGGSFGLQAGVDLSDVVLVFTNRAALDLLARGTLVLGGDLSNRVGPVGRQTEFGTDGLVSAVYSYSRSKGLYAGLSFQGSGMGASKRDNAAVYGAGVTPLRLLTSQPYGAHMMLNGFLNRLNHYAP